MRCRTTAQKHAYPPPEQKATPISRKQTRQSKFQLATIHHLPPQSSFCGATGYALLIPSFPTYLGVGDLLCESDNHMVGILSLSSPYYTKRKEGGMFLCPRNLYAANAIRRAGLGESDAHGHFFQRARATTFFWWDFQNKRAGFSFINFSSLFDLNSCPCYYAKSNNQHYFLPPFLG
jgi:hypothetical protein